MLSLSCLVRPVELTLIHFSISMELKDLKHNLKIALKQSGAVDSIKAQMRKEFIASMNTTQSFSPPSSSGHSLEDKLLYSIVYHTLKARGLTHSVSVFSAEVGFDSSSQNNSKLTEFDIANYLNIAGTHKPSTTKHDASCGDGDSDGNKENTGNFSTVDSSRKGATILESILDQLGKKHAGGSTTTSAQTDDELAGGSSVHQFYHIKQSLNDHLKDIRTTYSIRKDLEREVPSITVEERMMQLSSTIRSECEAKFRNDHEHLYVQLNNSKAQNATLQGKLNDGLNARGDLSQKYEEDRQNQHLQFTAEKSKLAILTNKYEDLQNEFNEFKQAHDDERKILLSQLGTEKARVQGVQSKYTELMSTSADQNIRYEEEKQSHVLEIKSERSKFNLLQGKLQETMSDLAEISSRYEETKLNYIVQLGTERSRAAVLEARLQECGAAVEGGGGVGSAAAAAQAASGESGAVSSSIPDNVVLPRVKYNKLLARCKELEVVVKDQKVAIGNFVRAQQKQHLLRKLVANNDAELHSMPTPQAPKQFDPQPGTVGYPPMYPPHAIYQQQQQQQYPQQQQQQYFAAPAAGAAGVVEQQQQYFAAPAAGAAGVVVVAPPPAPSSGPSPDELERARLQAEEAVGREQAHQALREEEVVRRRVVEEELAALRRKETDRLREEAAARAAVQDEEIAVLRRKEAELLREEADAREREIDALREKEVARRLQEEEAGARNAAAQFQAAAAREREVEELREKEVVRQRGLQKLREEEEAAVNQVATTNSVTDTASTNVQASTFASKKLSHNSFAPDSDDDSPSDKSDSRDSDSEQADQAIFEPRQGASSPSLDRAESPPVESVPVARSLSVGSAASLRRSGSTTRNSFAPDSDDDSPSDDSLVTDVEQPVHTAQQVSPKLEEEVVGEVNTEEEEEEAREEARRVELEKEAEAQRQIEEAAARAQALEDQKRLAEEEAQRRREEVQERRRQQEEELRLERERQREEVEEQQRQLQAEKDAADTAARVVEEERQRAEAEEARLEEKRRVAEEVERRQREEAEAVAEEERKRKQAEEDNDAIAEARRKVLERRKMKSSIDGSVTSSTNFDNTNASMPSVVSSMGSAGSLTAGAWTDAARGSRDSYGTDSDDDSPSERGADSTGNSPSYRAPPRISSYDNFGQVGRYTLLSVLSFSSSLLLF